MRTGRLLSIVFLTFCHLLYSQELSFGVAYNYLYSRQWDKAIQYYNSSRPFLEEKLPLLQHGLTVNSDFYFRSNTAAKHGIIASYSNTSIGADNSGLNVRIRMHQMQLGYSLKLENCFGWDQTFLTFDAAVIGGKIVRLVNDKEFLYEEEKYGAYGAGGMLEAQMGYQFTLGEKGRLSPFMKLGYSPYYFFPGVEKVINQTQGLVYDKRTGLFSAQVGVRYQFLFH